jgi:hypothetical protein
MHEPKGPCYTSPRCIHGQTIATIEREAAIRGSAGLDVERLKEAHHNLFINTGQAIMGGYVDALAAEYARLARTTEEP